jgi:hypothetical protein
MACLGRIKSLATSGVMGMITRPRSFWILAIAILGMLALLAPLPAFGQSCALCYTQAAASGSRMIQALKSGILILIAPPTFMSIGLIFVCYRKRNQTRNANRRDQGEWGTGITEDSYRKEWE